MRISYFWSEYPYLGPRLALPPEAELVYTGNDATHYGREFSERWINVNDDLMIVEQDITIRPDIIEAFESCKSPWCVFPYGGLTESLGCARFRSTLRLDVGMRQIIDARAIVYGCLPVYVACDSCNSTEICWQHLDLKVAGALISRGYRSCVHSPDVQHR